MRLWLVAGLLLLCVVAQAGEMATALTVRASNGCAVGGGEITLLEKVPTQREAKFVVLEAEDAAYVDPQGDAAAHRSGRNTNPAGVAQVYAGETRPYEPGKDPKASGGAYIDYVDQVSMDFNVTTPGKYYRWVRYYITWGGSWVYQSQVDDSPTQRILLNNLKIADYFWQRDEQPYTLTAGTHKHHCLYVHGGKRIDKVIFTSDADWQPDQNSMEREKDPLDVITRGTVVTAPLAPVGVTRYTSLLMPGARNGGSLQAEVSLDGTTFRPVPASGDLSTLPASAKPVFRFTLVRGAQGAAPVLPSPVVVYEADATAYLTLEDDAIRLLLDRATGAPAGIVNKRTGVTVAESGVPTPLLSLTVKKPREQARMIPWEQLRVERVTADKRAVTTVYIAPTPAGDVRLTSVIRLTGRGQATFRVSVENRSQYDVQEVQYPNLAGLKLGETGDDDVLVWPYQAGQFKLGPSRCGTMEIGYPAGMQWVDIFDDHGGMYLGCHTDYIVATEVRTVADTAIERIALSFTKKHRIKPAATRAYTYVLAAHAGDWHDGADLYRTWFYSAFPHPKLPQWLKDAPAWYAWSQLKNGQSRHYTELRTGFDTALALGLNYCQIWGSTFNGACPSYYLPRAESGGEDLFAAMNQWWRRQGETHVGYYFHGNSTGYSYVLGKDTLSEADWAVIKPAFDDFCARKKIEGDAKLALWQTRFEQGHGKYFDTPWSAYPPDVQPMTWDAYVKHHAYPNETYTVDRTKYLQMFTERQARPWEHNSEDDYERFASQSTLWQDFLLFWTDRYVNKYHCDTVYYDTMAFGCEEQEYNPYLGLHGEGDSAMHRLALLDRFINESRRTTPSYTNLVEGVGDVWGTRMYMLLSGFARDPEIFRYTFPDMVLVQGHANGYWSGPKSFESIREAFLLGNKFDILHPSTMVRDLLYLREQLGPWGTRGVYKDNLGLTVADRRVRARGFKIDAGGSKGVLVTFENADEVDGVAASVDLGFYGINPRAVWLYAPHAAPQPLPCYTRDGRLHFVADKAYNSAVLLLERAAGEFALTAATRRTDFDDRIQVELINYTEKPIAATARFASTEVQVDQPERACTAAPGSTTLRYNIANVAARTMTQTGTFTLSASGLPADKLLIGVLPRIKDPGFEFFVHPNTSREVKLDGKLSIDVSKLGASREIFLEHGKRFNLSVWVKPDAAGHLPAIAVVQGTARTNFTKTATTNADGWVRMEARDVPGLGYTPDNWLEARQITVGAVKEAQGPVYVDGFVAELIP